MTRSKAGRPAGLPLLGGALCCCLATSTLAQAPVEDLRSREQGIQRGQQHTGAAYRDLRQAQYEAKLAEQDLLNAQEAQAAARKHADEMKRQLDAAQKAFDAAKAREALARKSYEEALRSVDRAFQKPPVNSK